MDLPIDLKWFSSETKLDVGDINGDCYADVVFTQMGVQTSYTWASWAVPRP